MTTADEVTTRITERLIEAMESDPGRWTKCWTGDGAGVLPYNATTGVPYRGINTLMLWFAGMDRCYPSPRWATYRQWAEAGAQVRKGEKGESIVVFKPLPDKESTAGDGSTLTVRRGFWKHYHVFNSAQVDGDTVEEAEPFVATQDEIVAFVCAVPHRVAVGAPSYSPAHDVVYMLPAAAFHTENDYWATYLHELAHWTGHKDRLGRSLEGRFGSDAYAMEELTAELSAVFSCARLGIEVAERPDHAQYLANWTARLRAEPTILRSIASSAQAATEYLATFSEAREMEAAS